jgi:Tol biopolymer transport system component
MDNQGGNPQKILGLAADETLQYVQWSPDGQRLVYVRWTPQKQITETCDLQGSNRTTVLVASYWGPFVRGLSWLPDRRIVYSQGETLLNDANLWQIGVDPHTGIPNSKPKRITRWAGSSLRGLSASADGNRLVLQKETFPRQIYIGELAAGGTRMNPPQRLTHDEAYNATTAWTADSKSLLLYSDRNGKWGIYKQEIGQDKAVPLVEGREDVDLPRLSPDGVWVLYRESSMSAGNAPLSRIMRVPANGGLPELVSEIVDGSDYRCTIAPASLCVIFEEGENQPRLTVTAFDPIKGRGKLLRTVEKDPKEGLRAALSPDGSIIAVTKQDGREIHIRLLPISGGTGREIEVMGWPNMSGIDWAADGKGIYVGSTSSQGGTLLYVDLKGTAQVVWQTRESTRFLGGIASPDGRHLAIWAVMHNSTAWIVEGF